MIKIRSYKLKLKPNKQQFQKLNNYFYEAKCLYNYVLSQENVFKFDTKTKNITTLDKDKNIIEVELTNLGSKLRQNIVHRLQDNIRNLSKSKKKGNKIGKLKYKSEINCIDLDNQCFKIINNKIQLRKDLKIKLRGLRQLGNAIKTRNAWLIKECNNYYISICCDVEVEEHIKTNKQIGIDMGIKDNVTLSNGEKLNLSIGESEQIKRLQKKLVRSQKGSKNRYKVKLDLQKAYKKITNKKKDFVNKLVHRLDQETSGILLFCC
jgi:transposase